MILAENLDLFFSEWSRSQLVGKALYWVLDYIYTVNLVFH